MNWFQSYFQHFYSDFEISECSQIRSNKKRFHVSFTQFPLMVTCCKISQLDIDTYIVKMQNSFNTKVLLMSPFYTHIQLLPLWSLGTTNLFSISLTLTFQECYVNGVMQYWTLQERLFFTWHNSLGVHPTCGMYHSSFLYCTVVFHRIDVP